jgi:hypothetical protein
LLKVPENESRRIPNDQERYGSGEDLWVTSS